MRGEKRPLAAFLVPHQTPRMVDAARLLAASCPDRYLRDNDALARIHHPGVGQRRSKRLVHCKRIRGWSDNNAVEQFVRI